MPTKTSNHQHQIITGHHSANLTNSTLTNSPNQQNTNCSSCQTGNVGLKPCGGCNQPICILCQQRVPGFQLIPDSRYTPWITGCTVCTQLAIPLVQYAQEEPTQTSKMRQLFLTVSRLVANLKITQPKNQNP